MRTPDATSCIPDLELSQQPDLRRAQVDILVRVLNAFEGQRGPRIMPWNSLALLADAPAVKEATDAWLAASPAAADQFESFDALAARRDASSIVRLHR